LITVSFFFALFVCSVYSDAASDNDIVALNFALTLERLESNYYKQGLAIFSAKDFERAGFNGVHAYFALIKNHENAHVRTLVDTINNNLGGHAVPVCTYDFGFTDNVTYFIDTARVFENVGVTAYDGAINTLSNLSLRTVAATIATVEARHAAYLNELLGHVPFPKAFDTPVSPHDVGDIIAPFIKSCPYTIQYPVVANFPCAK